MNSFKVKTTLALINLVLLTTYGYSQNTVSDSILKPVKVSGYLFYDDQSKSSFDILNDNSLILYNVIIGGGDAVKPANAIVIHVEGEYQFLDLTVKEKGKIIRAERDILANGANDILITKVGCEKLLIEIERNDDEKKVYSNTVNFKCGE